MNSEPCFAPPGASLLAECMSLESGSPASAEVKSGVGVNTVSSSLVRNKLRGLRLTNDILIPLSLRARGLGRGCRDGLEHVLHLAARGAGAARVRVRV